MNLVKLIWLMSLPWWAFATGNPVINQSRSPTCWIASTVNYLNYTAGVGPLNHNYLLYQALLDAAMEAVERDDHEISGGGRLRTTLALGVSHGFRLNTEWEPEVSLFRNYHALVAGLAQQIQAELRRRGRPIAPGDLVGFDHRLRLYLDEVVGRPNFLGAPISIVKKPKIVSSEPARAGQITWSGGVSSGRIFGAGKTWLNIGDVVELESHAVENLFDHVFARVEAGHPVLLSFYTQNGAGEKVWRTLPSAGQPIIEAVLPAQAAYAKAHVVLAYLTRGKDLIALDSIYIDKFGTAERRIGRGFIDHHGKCAQELSETELFEL